MHLPTTSIVLLLGLRFCVMGEDESNCHKACELLIQPICAKIQISEGNHLDCTFPNDCYLEIYTCKTGKKELEQKPEICPNSFPECGDIILNTVIPQET